MHQIKRHHLPAHGAYDLRIVKLILCITSCESDQRSRFLCDFRTFWPFARTENDEENFQEMRHEMWQKKSKCFLLHFWASHSPDIICCSMPEDRILIHFILDLHIFACS